MPQRYNVRNDLYILAEDRVPSLTVWTPERTVQSQLSLAGFIGVTVCQKPLLDLHFEQGDVVPDA
jgi:hypothetical protein